MEAQYKQKVEFENVWEKNDPEISAQVVDIWKNIGRVEDAKIEDRLKQIVYVAKNEHGKVIGVSTALKAYIQQLRNNFYIFRCLIVPDNSIPGMDTKLTVLTRDFLESIHHKSEGDKAIGVLALIENLKLRERNRAIWHGSGFVYIGNSKEGNHIRVYYFKGARIQP
jgi:hypothetical protein